MTDSQSVKITEAGNDAGTQIGARTPHGHKDRPDPEPSRRPSGGHDRDDAPIMPAPIAPAIHRFSTFYKAY